MRFVIALMALLVSGCLPGLREDTAAIANLCNRQDNSCYSISSTLLVKIRPVWDLNESREVLVGKSFTVVRGDAEFPEITCIDYENCGTVGITFLRCGDVVVPIEHGIAYKIEGQEGVFGSRRCARPVILGSI